jgi:hypothetical protein
MVATLEGHLFFWGVHGWGITFCTWDSRIICFKIYNIHGINLSENI